MGNFCEGEVWFVEFPKVMNLQPDDFIFKIGSLHPDDLERIEELYIHFMDGTLPDK